MHNELPELKPLNVNISLTYREDENNIIRRLKILNRQQEIRLSLELVDVFKAAITSSRIYITDANRHRGFIPQAAISLRQLIETLLQVTTSKNLKILQCKELMGYIIKQWKSKKPDDLSTQLHLHPKQIEKLDKKFYDYETNNPKRLEWALMAFELCFHTSIPSTSSRNSIIKELANETIEVLDYLNGCAHHARDARIERFFEYYEKCKRILLVLLEPYAEVQLPIEE